MKILRLLTFASASFFIVSAQAQTSGTVTNHAFAIGKGAGQTGFTSLLCAATQLAVGQDAANPACKELSGDLTMDADGVTAIGANKVTDAMMRQSGALSLIGRSANTSGNVADISAVAGSGCAYREAGNTIGCGELATAALGANIVTNAKLAQMANGTTKCRTTAGTGDPEDCTASQMRSLLSLVVGTNVQAWDADLDAVAALSSAGLIARTGAGTAAARTLTAPAAGLTITNPAGTAGNPTFALANDLAAVEGLSSTGIARRTGTDAWSVGTAVINSELATMANNRFKGNVSGSTAVPSDLTASQVLDAIGSTRGSVLYRGASGWSILTPGTSGQVLTSNGSGSDPTYQDAAGGSGGSDTDRRNVLLDRIYQSKLFTTVRRVVNSWATGFKAATDADRGINTANSANIDTSNAAASGYVQPLAGSATSATPGTTAALQNFTVFDRSFNLTNGKVVKKIGLYNNQGAKTLSVKIGKRNSSGNYDIVVSQSVSHTGTGWEDFTLSSPYTIPGSGTYQVGGYTGSPANPNVIASVARSYASTDIGVSSGVTFTEDTGQGIGVRAIYDTENMTLVTASQTTDSSVSNARALIEYDNTDSPALDTDLIVEVTCDGGANWASAALSTVTSNSQGGRSVAETADTACTAGTSFAARIKTGNRKNVPVYGASVTVR